VKCLRKFAFVIYTNCFGLVALSDAIFAWFLSNMTSTRRSGRELRLSIQSSPNHIHPQPISKGYSSSKEVMIIHPSIQPNHSPTPYTHHHKSPQTPSLPSQLNKLPITHTHRSPISLIPRHTNRRTNTTPTNTTRMRRRARLLILSPRQTEPASRRRERGRRIDRRGDRRSGSHSPARRRRNNLEWRVSCDGACGRRCDGCGWYECGVVG